MQHQPHLVGIRLRAGGPVRGEMGFPGLDVVLGLTPGRVELLVKMLTAPALEIGHDIAGVPSAEADLDPGNDAAWLRPRPGRIGEGLEPAQLLCGTAGVALGRGRLERQDMCRQPCILRKSEDIKQADPVTEIENLRGAVMAVGSQQDLGPRPEAADLPDQPTDMGRDFGSFWASGGTQQGPDQPSLPVEDHDGLEAIFIVIGIEQAKLLMAVGSIEGVVDVQHDLPGRPGEGLAVEPDHLPPHAEQGPEVGKVFHPRDGGLRAALLQNSPG